MRMSWRRIEDLFNLLLQKISSRRPQDVLIKTNICALVIRLQKTSWRHLFQEQDICLSHTSSRHLQELFKTSSRRLAKIYSRHLQDVLKTSSRHLQDVLPRRFQNVFKKPCENVIKISSKRLPYVLKTSSKRL